jgi:hypothetical protein
MLTRIWFENLKYEDHVRNLGIGGRILKRNVRRTGCEVLEWIHLVQKGGGRLL